MSKTISMEYREYIKEKSLLKERIKSSQKIARNIIQMNEDLFIGPQGQSSFVGSAGDKKHFSDTLKNAKSQLDAIEALSL